MKKAILPIVLAIVALAGTAYLALAPTSAQASGCCVDPATGLATCSPPASAPPAAPARPAKTAAPAAPALSVGKLF